MQMAGSLVSALPAVHRLPDLPALPDQGPDDGDEQVVARRDLVERLARLHPAVVSDCLDRIGLRDQVLAPRIRPLTPDSKLAGRARTVQCVAVDGVPGESRRLVPRRARGRRRARPGRRDGRLDLRGLVLGRAARDRLAPPRRERDRGRRLHARHAGADRDGLPDVRRRDPLRRLARPHRRRGGRRRDRAAAACASPTATSCSPTTTASSSSRRRSPARRSRGPRRRSRARASSARSSRKGMPVSEAFRTYGVI